MGQHAGLLHADKELGNPELKKDGLFWAVLSFIFGLGTVSRYGVSVRAGSTSALLDNRRATSRQARQALDNLFDGDYVGRVGGALPPYRDQP